MGLILPFFYQSFFLLLCSGALNFSFFIFSPSFWCPDPQLCPGMKTNLSFHISSESKLLNWTKVQHFLVENLCYVWVQSLCPVYLHKPHPNSWQCTKPLSSDWCMGNRIVTILPTLLLGNKALLSIFLMSFFPSFITGVLLKAWGWTSPSLENHIATVPGRTCVDVAVLHL